MTTQYGDGWLLHVSSELRAAVGLREMLHVLPDERTLHAVPRSRAYASRVIVWQQRLLPLIDLNVYLFGSAPASGECMIGIVACAGDPKSDSPVQLAGLRISRAPEKIQVADSQVCELPADAPKWRSIAASCFRHPQHGAVPILDLPALLIPA